MDTGRPYIENKDIRIFNQNTPEDEFVWHKDREDRLIDPVKETDWLLFIPKGVYHRLIKGTGDLSLKIIRK